MRQSLGLEIWIERLLIPLLTEAQRRIKILMTPESLSYITLVVGKIREIVFLKVPVVTYDPSDLRSHKRSNDLGRHFRVRVHYRDANDDPRELQVEILNN